MPLDILIESAEFLRLWGMLMPLTLFEIVAVSVWLVRLCDRQSNGVRDNQKRINLM
jgi:hypothetical protein